MLTEICGYLRNWFERDKYIGFFAIEDGKITGNKDFNGVLLEGQYIRIIGSILNDGVYQYSEAGIEGLKDEFFQGAVWSLAIPKELVTLSNDIKIWSDKNGGADSVAMSPYQSESFGGYSYSKGASASGNYAAGDWKSVFASRLDQWRKI